MKLGTEVTNKGSLYKEIVLANVSLLQVLKDNTNNKEDIQDARKEHLHGKSTVKTYFVFTEFCFIILPVPLTVSYSFV